MLCVACNKREAVLIVYKLYLCEPCFQASIRALYHRTLRAEATQRRN